MLQGGQQPLIRPVFLMLSIIVLVSGFMVSKIYTNRVARHLIQTLPIDQDNIGSPLRLYLGSTTDVNKLLKLGYHLAAAEELTALEPVTLRLAAIAPENRDANLLMAWYQLTTMANSNNTPDEHQLAAASQALATAGQIDPLNPTVKALKEAMAKAQGNVS